MGEKIISIEGVDVGEKWSRTAGYKVITTEQEIVLLIDDESH